MSRNDFTLDWFYRSGSSSPLFNFTGLLNDSFSSSSSSLSSSSSSSSSSFWWMKKRGWDETGQGRNWMLLVSSLLSLGSLLGNSLVVAVTLGWSRLRTGQGVLLANASLADLLFVLLSLPPVLIANLGSADLADGSKSLSAGSGLCRSVHYLLSVCLYVSIYSPVAACVFRFFAELLRRGRPRSGRREGNRAGPNSGSRGREFGASNHCSSPSSSSSSSSSSSPSNSNSAGDSLTVCNAVVSCVVIWTSFLLANVNVLHGETYGRNAAAVVGLHQPTLCNELYALGLHRQLEQQKQQKQEQQQQRRWKEETEGMSLQSLVYKEHAGQRHHSRQQQQQQQQQQQGVKAGGGKGGGSRNEADPEAKMRTLWLIFLVSAFLVPLAIVSLLSGILLFWIQCKRQPIRDPIADVIAAQESSLIVSTRANASLAASRAGAHPSRPTGSAAVGRSGSGSSERDGVVLVMAVSVARSLCWLPVQICLLVDVFGLSREDRVSALHQRTEVFGVCFALLGCFMNPVILYCSLRSFREGVRRLARRLVARRRDKRQRRTSGALTLERLSAARSQARNSRPMPGCDGRAYCYGSPGRSLGSGPRLGPGSMKRVESDANETILSIISDSSNRINYS